jgi:hypothetical protein
MKPFVLAAFAATSVLLPAITSAATINTSLTYERNNTGLDGGSSVGFNRFTTADVGIATLRFGAEASGGDVDAKGTIGFSTTFADTVSFGESANVSVALGLNSLSFNYSAFTGAEAGAFVNFKSFAGVDLSEFRVIGDDYRLDTSGSRNSFGSTGNNRDTEAIAGVGPDVSFGLGVRARVSLNASQTTSFAVTDFQGTLQATHESGVTRTTTFSLLGSPLRNLDLSLAGEWTLGLENLGLRNSFDSATGISSGYELGLAAGELFGGCGDYSDDDDNAGFLDLPAACLADTGVSGDTAQLNLLNPSPFEINWGRKSVSLGSLSVLAEIVDPVTPVPLPAGMPLLLAGLAGFAGLRRLKQRSTI